MQINVRKQAWCLFAALRGQLIPRSPGGEITPEGLMAVGRIAREFNLYTKITGSQRLAMFGAQKDDRSKHIKMEMQVQKKKLIWRQ